jgi:hypothetical protein
VRVSLRRTALLSMALLAALGLLASGRDSTAAPPEHDLLGVLKAHKLTAIGLHLWSRAANSRAPASVAEPGCALSQAHIFLVGDAALTQERVKSLSLKLRSALEAMGSPGLMRVVLDLYIRERVTPHTQTPDQGHPFQRTGINKSTGYREEPAMDEATDLKNGVGWYARSVWLRGHDVQRDGDAVDAVRRVTDLHAWMHGAWWASDNAKPDGPAQAFPVRVD